MERVRYTGDKDYTLKYVDHGRDVTLMLRKNEWYHLPEDDGTVKYLRKMGALTKELAPVADPLPSAAPSPAAAPEVIAPAAAPEVIAPADPLPAPAPVAPPESEVIAPAAAPEVIAPAASPVVAPGDANGLVDAVKELIGEFEGK